MSRQTILHSIASCALVLSTLAVNDSPAHLKGHVQTPDNNPPVAREQVTIDGAGKYTTDDTGEFEFDLVQGLKVGQPARFRVNHVNPGIKIQQWVVIRPCDLQNGRTDSLPDVGSSPITIRVLPRGDQRLKSLNKDYSILGCIIEEAAANFRPNPPPRESNRGSLLEGGASIISDQIRRELPYQSWVTRKPEFPVMVEIGYQIQEQKNPSSASLEDGPDSVFSDPAVSAGKAVELGFTPVELSEALDTWVHSGGDDYQKGLAALYQRRYAEASKYIAASIPFPPGELLKRYVPYARSEYEQGHYAAAEIALRKVLAVHGEDLLILNNLGVVLSAEAKYDEAEALFRQALAINDAAAGLDMAECLNNLGSLYYLQGKYIEAEAVLNRALAIYGKTLGPDHPNVATGLNNLAAVYKLQGKYSKAEPLYRRALRIDEQVLGSGHPNVARDSHNLAMLYKSQGKYSDAEPLFRRAITIHEKTGPEHPDLADNLSGLAELLVSQGKYDMAEPLYQRALKIAENSLGPDHPNVSAIVNNLALLYKQQGKYDKAEPLYKRALTNAEKMGAMNPHVAIAANNLAALYRIQGRYEEAEPLYKRALAIDEIVMGPDHPNVARRLNGLAILYSSQSKNAEAELLFKRALSIAEKGQDDELLATIAENLASCLHQLGRDDEAGMYVQKAAKIRGKKGK
jgi:tetratricopeptide (TPR) repeat protein